MVGRRCAVHGETRWVGSKGGDRVRDQGRHALAVDDWLARAPSTTPERRLALFERAFAALWGRTRNTLGDVTLEAITNRVLFSASERFPSFSSLTVEPTRGIQSEGLRGQLHSLSDAELREGIRFVLVEFLTVLGNLTAEILTPELHRELSLVAPPDDRP